MKTQRNIIYITLSLAIISLLVYMICVYLWLPNSICGHRWNTFISNLDLGIWGSSIISLVISYISYNDCRKVSMEKFRYAIEDLILHCETYNKYESGYEWYKNFEKFLE
jgi:hypothetical protein